MAEKQHSTIIVIPHADGKVYKLRISPRALRLAAVAAASVLILTIVSIVTSGSFLRHRAMVRSLERENTQLKRYNQRLSETVTQVQARLDQFEERTRSLAIAAGVSDLLSATADPVVTNVGSGGPLDRLASAPEGLVDKQDFIDRQLSRVERSLSEQAVLLSHTPSVAPVVGVITDGFGPRLDPFTHRPAFHDGLDISVAVGTPIAAPADGVVIFAGRESGYGKIVKVSHGFGYTTAYGHMDRFAVKEGDRVTRGQVIGKVGMTGRTTGPHLHYEVIKDGEKQNPLHFILDAY